MAQTLSAIAQQPIVSHPQTGPQNVFENRPRLPPTSVTIPQPAANIRNGHLNLDVFSPVNQNGSFEFDRVLKSGEVHKRTRKTKQWKKFYLVLRPNLLSIYKSSSEDRLHKQISLSDLTAVAYLKDPKGRRQNIFGLFSPAKNFHLQAKDEKDARDWVELIRHEARIDIEEEEMLYGSPITQQNPHQNIHSITQTMRTSDDHEAWDRERLGSSSPEPSEPSHLSTTRDGMRIAVPRNLPIHELDYSGNDHGSYSDVSDTAPARLYSQLSTSTTTPTLRTISNSTSPTPTAALPNPSVLFAKRPEPAHNPSQLSTTTELQHPALLPDNNDDRVIHHGYLLCLKSKGGVRQWKTLWAVLRPKTLAFYKNEDEYAAHLIIPLSSIISAVEIDPVSRSKRHCLQIIAEDRSFRFCATGEEGLARWLGALKSLLARRKGGENLNAVPGERRGAGA
ncbi:hypothetical protein MMC19_005942 [Ptychographa xylographoides]|nr:hypothetical protein [Ptychographa xylographoides]